jgi:hypothetical protein
MLFAGTLMYLKQMVSPFVVFYNNCFTFFIIIIIIICSHFGIIMYFVLECVTMFNWIIIIILIIIIFLFVIPCAASVIGLLAVNAAH